MNEFHSVGTKTGTETGYTGTVLAVGKQTRDTNLPTPLSLIHARSDRELLIGIFNAVCALAEKLTGEKLVVFLPSATGDWPYSGVPCAWLPKDHEGARQDLDALHESEHSSMPSGPR
jgi:hypothetical protein